jgi:hypothetical protein
VLEPHLRGVTVFDPVSGHHILKGLAKVPSQVPVRSQSAFERRAKSRYCSRMMIKGLAHRAFCAAAIRARPAALIVRFPQSAQRAVVVLSFQAAPFRTSLMPSHSGMVVN